MKTKSCLLANYQFLSFVHQLSLVQYVTKKLLDQKNRETLIKAIKIDK